MADARHAGDAAIAPDAFAALRVADFRRLVLSTLCVTVALLVQEVVIGYQLYAMTHQPLVLGLIGLAEAVPFIAVALFGGHFADRYERRNIMRGCLFFIALGSLLVLAVMRPAVRTQWSQASLLWVLYGSFAALGLARGFYSPAAHSLRGVLVPRALIPNASAWASASWQSGAIVGPVLAGALYAGVGLTMTLALTVLLLLTAIVLVSRLTPRPPPPVDAARTSLWRSLHEGIAFVFKTKIIIYSISLDLFSILFGGAVAILPVFAADILHVGPVGLGMLRAAAALGALATMLVCTRHPPVVRAWRNLLIAVAGFGVATLVFALSQWFWLSLLALFLTGAFDSVSVVIRGTILQMMPPEHLRGRVLSVNGIFLTVSNELGAFESGVAAQYLGAVPSVLAGAGVTLAIVAFVWARSRELFAVRLLGRG